MAHYIDFNGGLADFPEWSAAGAFSISFRTVFVDNDDLLVGKPTGTVNYIGAVSGAFRVAINGSAYSPGLAISNGDVVVGTIERDTNDLVTFTLNGQTYTNTMSGVFSLSRIGALSIGGSNYTSTVQNYYYLTLDNGTDSRDYASDGVGLPDAASGQDATLQGSYSFVEYDDTVEIDSISISEAVSVNQPYNVIGGNSTPSFSVAYTGTPSALRYRVVDADNGDILIPYTVFDSAPSGGTSLLSFSIPATLKRHIVEVDFSNNATITDSQSTPWLTGVAVPLAGQSLIEGLLDDNPVSPSSGVYKFSSGTIAQANMGAGQNALASVLVQQLGCSVVVANTAVSGTCMTNECAISRGAGDKYWANPSSTLSSDMISSVQSLATDDMLFSFCFGQGQTDAVVNSPPASYLTGLNDVIERVRTEATLDGTNTLPVVIGVLGRNTSSGNDASAQAIREKQLEYLNSDPSSTGVLMYTYGTDDGTHPNDAGDIALGEAIAYAMLGYKPPKVAGISVNNALTEITLTFDKDLKSDATYSTEGVRVNSGGVEQTVSSFTRTGIRTAAITLSQAMPAPDNVDVYVGYGTGSTSNLLTYPSASDGSDLVMMPYSNTGIDFGSISSITLNIGAPDGDYKVYLLDEDDNVVYNGNATFSNGSTTILGLTVLSGTVLEGYTIDNESPHVEGAVITGVTV